MSRLLITLIGMVLTLPGTLAADSDGYYCIGSGYLAYEIRFAPDASEHRLHIVRFSSRDGIVPSATVRLEDFQVREMRCTDTAIVIVGGRWRYTVDLAGPGAPSVSRAADSSTSTEPLANLGHWGTEGVVDIGGEGSPDEFQLVIARVSRQVEGGIEHYTATRLVQRDFARGGAVVASLPLFDDIFLETIH